jgi:ribosome-associated protein
MIQFPLDTPYIELIKLLKATRVADSGASAKALVDSGRVSRDGQPESRKRAKIRPGETITTPTRVIRVVGPPPAPLPAESAS